MTSSGIPLVDISGPDPEDIAKKLVHAAATYGFVYIRNTGKEIPIPAIERSFELSKQFFASPIEQKRTARYRGDTNSGWSGMNEETLDAKSQRIGDFKEAFNFHEFENNLPRQCLPASLDPHQAEISQFFTHCKSLCHTLLTLFGLGLSIPASSGGATWFTTRHATPSGTILRYLFYPSLSAHADYDPDLDIRCGAHSDYGSLTLLFQRPGQPGLEVLTTNPDGTSSWKPVEVSPPGTENDPSPPILVNVGDLMEYWTNGLLKSTVHRVIVPEPTEDSGKGKDRYSIAFFCHPTDTTLLEAVPSEMVRERARKGGVGAGSGAGAGEDGKVITAKEHLMMRLKASYLGVDFGAEKAAV